MNNGLNGMNQLNLNDNRWKSRNEINFGLYNLLRQWVMNKKKKTEMNIEILNNRFMLTDRRGKKRFRRNTADT